MLKMLFIAVAVLSVALTVHADEPIDLQKAVAVSQSESVIVDQMIRPDATRNTDGSEDLVAGSELDAYDVILLQALQAEEMKDAISLTGLQAFAEAKTDLPKEDASNESNRTARNGNNNSDDIEGNGIADPFYIWNAAMYHFNDKLYFWLIKPLSQGYSAIVPEPARIAVSNFFHNLTTPVRFVGSLMQLKLKNAADELVRLVTNSTQGIGGLFDVAKSHYGVTTRDEDIGQALGSYGIGHGMYIVWPFLGPSSLRDTVGLAGEVLLDPVTYVTPIEASSGINLYDRVNETSFKLGDYETMKESAFDPYVAMRNGYIQKRQTQVRE